MLASRMILAILLLGFAAPVGAQIRGQSNEQDDVRSAPISVPLQNDQIGRVADSAVGQVGQRQTREQAPTGIKSMARVANRIQNRVQNRIRNRIDRDYDPQAGMTDPFAVAEDRARRPTRR